MTFPCSIFHMKYHRIVESRIHHDVPHCEHFTAVSTSRSLKERWFKWHCFKCHRTWEEID